MTREELINSLASLETFSAVPKEFYETLGEHNGNRKKNDKKKAQPYSAEADPRISKYLAYGSRNDKGLDVQLQYISFSIVANLAFDCLNTPTGRQMEKMLELSGHTAEDMEDYVQQLGDITPEQVPSQRLAPTVFLLSRVLFDAMYDPTEWRRAKRREANPSLEKLRALVAYMKDEGLLCFCDEYDDTESDEDTAAGELYDDFVVRHAKYALKVQCITSELATARTKLQKRVTEIETEINRKYERAKTNRMKKYKSTSIAPLVAPTAPVALVPNSGVSNAITNTLQDKFEEDLAIDTERAMQTLRGELTEDAAMSTSELRNLIERYRQTLPSDVRDYTKQLDDERDALIDNFNKIVEDLCELQKTMQAEKDELAKIECIPIIAESAFRELLNGEDETFKLKIRVYVWQDFQAQSSIAVHVVPFKELEDDEAWDSMVPEANGKLGLKVFDEDDLVSLETEYNGESSKTTIPVASALAKLSEQTMDSVLYIRKSQVKMFKDAGYSNRRARDFAIVLATMTSIHNMETGCDRLDSAELYNAGNATGQSADIESAEAERAARVDAERRLKQAQKENQASRHEIRMLQKEIERLKREAADAKDTESELEMEQDEQGEEEIEYPYHTDLKVVVYGGFDVFHKELTKLLPDIRIVESSAHVDVAPVRNADIVFLQTNKTNHSNYWAVRDACRNRGIPYTHLNFASAKRCAEVMVQEIQKEEARKAAEASSNPNKEQAN